MPDSGSVNVKPVRVLLLEDSEIDAELLSAHLDKAGLTFHVDRVMNRRAFVSALEKNRHDVVLADYSLPDFDGLSALNIAQTLKPDLPFIFVSGVVGEEFATNALKRGASDYVLKRNLTRLATAVQRALDQAREREERRQAEAALARAEVRARLAIEGARLGLWDFDPRTGELDWDVRCKTMFGLPPETEIDYDVFLGSLHPDDRQRMDESVRRATTWSPGADGGFSDEFRIVTPDGVERWIHSTGQAQFADEACTRFVGVVRDITEARAAQAALRQLALTLEQQVAERTAERDASWRLSRDLMAVIANGRLRRVNPAWTVALGYPEDVLVGADLLDLVHPEDREAAETMLGDLAAGALTPRFQTRFLHVEGDWRWISWTAVPEGDAVYAVGRDITEERAAAEALAERNQQLATQMAERERVEKELQQMQRLEAVGQLTSGVAHDFNNLLTVILGNIAFVEKALSRLKTPSEVSPRLKHMKTAAERGAKLTGQMLAFSRRQKLEPKTVDLNETVASMRDLLQGAIGGAVRLETVLKSDLWPARVDPTQIELIILNLAINARDAMEVGGALTVETANVVLDQAPSRPEEPTPGDYVALSVSDTGTGMSDEVLAKAFEPFFTTKEVGRGSGLGLAQVYGFAKQSGGGVRIETKAGEGTTVRVYLPRAHGGLVRVEEAPRQPAAERPVGEQVALVVDDDSAVREITALMLEELGYTVLQAGSGDAALDILRSDARVDVLLADYAMPGMNGAETVKRALQLRPGLPHLFITGYADLAALREVGEGRIIQKPFRDNELARKIAVVVGASAKVVPLRAIGSE